MNKIFIYIFLILIALSSVYFYTLHRTEIPSNIRCSFKDVITDTKEIIVPGCFDIFNPGVVAYEDGYLMLAKVKKNDIISKIKRKLTKNYPNKLSFIKLDAEFNPIIINGNAICTEHSTFGGDPRLIKIGDDIYCLYFDRVIKENKNVIRMFVCKLIECEGRFELIEKKELKFKEAEKYYNLGLTSNSVEKNWTPFVFNGKLYLIYLISPHVIIEPNLDNGECKEIVANKNEPIWNYGMASGGTPAIEYSDGYLSFFHTHAIGLKPFSFFNKERYKIGQGVYIFGAYMFSKQYPFNIIRSTEFPLTGKSLYNGRRKIIFPTSLIVNDDNIYLLYGKDDAKIFISKIDVLKLKEQLKMK